MQRGPVIYTMESTDLPEDVDFYGVRLPRDAQWTATFEPDLLGGVTVLETDALAYESGDGTDEGLYHELPSAEPKKLPAPADPVLRLEQPGHPPHDRLDSGELKTTAVEACRCRWAGAHTSGANWALGILRRPEPRG